MLDQRDIEQLLNENPNAAVIPIGVHNLDQLLNFFNGVGPAAEDDLLQLRELVGKDGLAAAKVLKSVASAATRMHEEARRAALRAGEPEVVRPAQGAQLLYFLANCLTPIVSFYGAFEMQIAGLLRTVEAAPALSQASSQRRRGGFDGILADRARMEVCAPVLQEGVTAILHLQDAPRRVKQHAETVRNHCETMFATLSKRHRDEGLEIQHGNPILTDVALAVLRNIAWAGQVAEERETGEVAPYAIHRARMLLDTCVQTGFVQDANALWAYIESLLLGAWRIAEHINAASKPLQNALDKVTRRGAPRMVVDQVEIEAVLADIRLVAPDKIVPKESTKSLSKAER